ncbi:MAG TPA: STAS domain-containing protein [Planctomycetes bacterium]|nr:STAS domain-containing protein [Fuerstiella sp.]HIK94730.1 STAS domain-containing protein [Planctomycetota bacterium]
MTSSLQGPPFLRCDSVGDILVVILAADPRKFSDEAKQYAYNSAMKQMGLTVRLGLLIDLSRCEMLDSATMGILIQLSMEVIRTGARTAMCGASPAIRETLARLMLLEPTHRQLVWRQLATPVCAVTELQSPSHE